MKNLILPLLFLHLFFSCSQLSIENNLPKASGNVDEILLVTDSLSWQGETGEALKKIVKETHSGVINPEPYFNISFFPEEHFGGMFTKHHFIFIPTTLERIALNPLFKKMIPKHVVDKVINSTSYVLYKQKNVFSKNQTILFLIAKEPYYLTQELKNNKKAIQQVLEHELIEKYKKQLLEKPTNPLLIQRLEKERGIKIHLPKEYEIAYQEDPFIWFRNVSPEADLNIFISSKKYKNESDFDTSSIFSWQDSLSQKYIFADKKDSSYLMREPLAPPLIKTEADSTNYSIYMWGLWKMKHRAMGGSYVSRMVKSKQNERVYYIEGFVYAPGQEKLNYIRRLEAIIRTFEPGKLDE